MAALYIAEIEVTDPEGYEVYRAQVPPTVEKRGGRYLVRGGASTALEGVGPASRIAILQFPSVEATKAWFHSEDYAPVYAIRAHSAVSRSYVVEALDLEPRAGAAYYVGERVVHDEEAYKAYATGAAPTIAAHGGEYLVKGGAWEALEGDAPMPRVIVLRFADVAACLGWYHSPAYHAVHAIRDRAATSRTYVVEGA